MGLQCVEVSDVAKAMTTSARKSTLLQPILQSTKTSIVMLSLVTTLLARTAENLFPDMTLQSRAAIVETYTYHQNVTPAWIDLEVTEFLQLNPLHDRPALKGVQDSQAWKGH